MKKIICSILILTLLFSMTFPQMVFAGESPLQNKVAESQKEEIKRVTNKKASIENEQYSGDFGYRTLEDGMVEITSYSGNTEEDLILPDKLDEKPVTSIGNGAFSGYKFKAGLIIPDSVTSIGSRAFFDCGFNGTLVLPENLKEINDRAFFNCEFTGDLTIPDSVTSIGECTFYGCIFGGVLTLSKSLREMGYSAFYGCEFTGDLVISDSMSVSKWADESFSRCEFTGNLKLPNTPKKFHLDLGNTAFGGTIIFPESWSSIECSIYNTYFNGSLMIPEGITSIGDNAFRDCDFVGDIVLPKGLKQISSCAFENAHSEEVFGDFLLPEIPERMDDDIFGDKDEVFKEASLTIGKELGVNQKNREKSCCTV